MNDTNDAPRSIVINDDHVHDVNALPVSEGTLIIDDDPIIDDDQSLQEVPVLSRDVAGSLPTVTEIHQSESFRHCGPSPSLRGEGQVTERKKMYRSYAIRFLVVVIGLGVVVSIALAVTRNKNNANEEPISGNNFANYGGQEQISEDAKLGRFKSLVTYLSDKHGIKVKDVDSPHYEAAQWFSEEEDLIIPGSSNGSNPVDDELYAYRFLSRYVMALLYYSVNGPESLLLDYAYLIHSIDICYWNGFVVIGGNIVVSGVLCDPQYSVPSALVFPGFNMSGSIPSELGLLTSLVAIQFIGNELQGTIPTELCKLNQLKVLGFSENNMHGKLPHCIEELQMLQLLDLSNNMFSGSLPPTMSLTKSLRFVHLDDNFFDGNPVGVWQGLTALEHLHANGNNFTGDIRSLFSPSLHTNLTTLDISQNSFTSEDGFPNHLLAMPNLIVLDLSDNKLSCKFPSTIEENPILKFLSLYNNSVSGKIPSSIKNLVNLVHIDVSTNLLTGPMVSEIGELQNLTRLFLSNNPKLETGNIPESFSDLSRLEELSLRNTNRTGSLPEYLGNMDKLILLDLSSNNFSGSVPSSWKNLTQMEYLLLNANPDIDGEASDTLRYMLFLRAAFLDGTNIAGNFSDLCEAWNSTVFNKLPGTEVLFADCGGDSPNVVCTCCTCCDSANDVGCSKPLLSNLDAEWETGFRRDYFAFTNYTKYQGSYGNYFSP